MRFLAGVMLAACLAPGTGQAATGASDDGEQALQTLWEALWHQSGTPTRLARWEADIRLRLSGVNLPAHRDTVLKALRAVTQEAGVRLVDVTDLPGEAANLSIEIMPDQALEDAQPCVTMLDFRSETRIESAQVQMRGRDVWRCAHHEAMHVMGVRGHPAGQTVLSYFPVKVDGLLPLDRAMLRAWYSPRMRAGMTPFEALPVLADEAAALETDKAAAAQARERFFATVIEQSRAFAAGQGDIPGILHRSGKTTAEGLRQGRIDMSYFLGVAYLEGAGVPCDRAQAVRWFERAASAGNRRAQARLSGMR